MFENHRANAQDFSEMPRRSVSNKAMSLFASPTTTCSSFLTLRSTCSPCTAAMYQGFKQGDFNGWLTRSTTTWMMSCKPAGRRSFRICLASARNPWINSLHQWPIRRSNRYSGKRETGNDIAKQVVSIAVQEHKANTVLSPLAEGAVAAAQKHPDDALLQATARVVQTQAAPVKKDKPVAVSAGGKKTAGRQALKAKQWLEHQYRQEYTTEWLCPHCGQKHPRKLICNISDYLRVVQHNLRELLHEGQFSCPVVACSHFGTA